MLLRPDTWFFLNWSPSATFAFGKPFRLVSSACVFASVTPPFIVTNVKRFFGCAYSASKVLLEMVTGPKGEPPAGGAKRPLTVRTSVLPVGVRRVNCDPDVRL